jgi:hypothetical protein
MAQAYEQPLHFSTFYFNKGQTTGLKLVDNSLVGDEKNSPVTL